MNTWNQAPQCPELAVIDMKVLLAAITHSDWTIKARVLDDVESLLRLPGITRSDSEQIIWEVLSQKRLEQTETFDDILARSKV